MVWYFKRIKHWCFFSLDPLFFGFTSSSWEQPPWFSCTIARFPPKSGYNDWTALKCRLWPSSFFTDLHLKKENKPGPMLQAFSWQGHMEFSQLLSMTSPGLFTSIALTHTGRGKSSAAMMKCGSCGQRSPLVFFLKTPCCSCSPCCAEAEANNTEGQQANHRLTEDSAFLETRCTPVWGFVFFLSLTLLVCTSGCVWVFCHQPIINPVMVQKATTCLSQSLLHCTAPNTMHTSRATQHTHTHMLRQTTQHGSSPPQRICPRSPFSFSYYTIV